MYIESQNLKQSWIIYKTKSISSAETRRRDWLLEKKKLKSQLPVALDSNSTKPFTYIYRGVAKSMHSKARLPSSNLGSIIYELSDLGSVPQFLHL